ncbi:MAG: DEAD/DEAH box helicase [Campylobacterota bacterium]|nr:DEAD/DEAH box helicase [Campylobacterota bacterium]
MPLSKLGLSPEIIKALRDRGYKEPTAIQTELIPAMMSGRDVMAGAQTGTGKTAGFVLPILQKLIQRSIPESSEAEQHILRALILVPTKELARQVEEHIQEYSFYLPLKSTVVYGGSPIAAQSKRIKTGIDILVGTPGRVLEHLEQKTLDIKGVDYFVLDEADTILDMGFIREVMRIIQFMKQKRQNIFISATLPGALKELSQELLHKPLQIEMSTMGSVAELVKQVLHPVEKEKKLELLSYLIGFRNYDQVLVFVRKKEVADEVAKELNTAGLKTAVIHGDRTSGARSRALSDFKEKKVCVLVATDIAARGLDIKNLDVVVNYDIPHVTQDFIHRVGRTGRAGRKGIAITLSSPEESIALKSVERMIGKVLQVEVIPGYAPPVEEVRKRAINKDSEKKGKTSGAFGKKKTGTTTKKRKTTKRDGFGSAPTPEKKNKKKSGRRRSRK